MVAIDFASDLIEECVHLSIRKAEQLGSRLPVLYHEEREEVYELSPGEREEAFVELARHWFGLLGLGRPVRQAIDLCTCVREGVEIIEIRRALREKEEGSELFADGGGVDRPPRARLVLYLRSERFLDRRGLLDLVLQEALYAEDMLDPLFEYRPELPRELEEDRARKELVRDRLAVLWRARIRGRVRELLGERSASTAVAGFEKAFAGLEAPVIAPLFRSASEGRVSSYPSLLAVALDPRAPRAAQDRSSTAM